MRKHRHEEHLNHEAWAIPYADLMTLLLAFFVVMYAVSVVNEGKYRVMSQSLVQAFNGSSGSTATPQVTPSSENTSAAMVVERSEAAASAIPLPVPTRSPTISGAGNHRGAGQETLHQIENQVRRALQPLIDQKMVVVRRKQDWLEIEIRTDILFPSGVAQLSASANQVLRSLATILAPFPNPLRVEGFTDNIPISTLQYPSNWELSAARAASVARLFASSGVNPDRLGIVGWGEVRPATDNATFEGRNQNRRVLVVVMNDQPKLLREQSDGDHLRDIAGTAAAAPAVERLPTVSVRPVAPSVVEEDAGLPVVPIMITQGAHHVGKPTPSAAEASASTLRHAGPDR